MTATTIIVRLSGFSPIALAVKLSIVALIAKANYFAATEVSTFTEPLVPIRSGNCGSTSSTRIFTGTRCAIFTQLPVAFCVGNKANAAPLPPLMLSTVP
jgi:hypothetical protein